MNELSNKSIENLINKNSQLPIVQQRFEIMKTIINKKGGEKWLHELISRHTYYEYIHSYLWKVISEYCRSVSPKCSHCNSKENLQLHHLTYKHLGTEIYHLEDLTVYCQKCHAIATILQQTYYDGFREWEQQYYKPITIKHILEKLNHEMVQARDKRT